MEVTNLILNETLIKQILQVGYYIAGGIIGIFGMLIGRFVYDYISGHFTQIKDNTKATQQNTETLIRHGIQLEKFETTIIELMGLKTDVNKLGEKVRKLHDKHQELKQRN